MPLAAHAADWPTERTQLVAAAEKEGEVDIFSQPNLAARTFIAAEWAKAFPQIKLSVTATEGSQIVGRIRIERAVAEISLGRGHDRLGHRLRDGEEKASSIRSGRSCAIPP